MTPRGLIDEIAAMLRLAGLDDPLILDHHEIVGMHSDPTHPRVAGLEVARGYVTLDVEAMEQANGLLVRALVHHSGHGESARIEVRVLPVGDRR